MAGLEPLLVQVEERGTEKAAMPEWQIRLPLAGMVQEEFLTTAIIPLSVAVAAVRLAVHRAIEAAVRRGVVRVLFLMAVLHHKRGLDMAAAVVQAVLAQMRQLQ